MEPALLLATFAAAMAVPARLEAFVRELWTALCQILRQILRLTHRGALVPTIRRSVRMEPALLLATFAVEMAATARLEAFAREQLSALNPVLPLPPYCQRLRALLPCRNRAMAAAFQLVPFAAEVAIIVHLDASVLVMQQAAS